MRIVSFELHGDMEQYADDIQKFVDVMIHKLHKNTHKGRWENIHVLKAYSLMVGETDELAEALGTNNKEEVYLECADVANFAMIIASITRERGND
jgi:NTP pyrophosphatase (non-canonical NTP hydrolase)